MDWIAWQKQQGMDPGIDKQGMRPLTPGQTGYGLLDTIANRVWTADTIANRVWTADTWNSRVWTSEWSELDFNLASTALIATASDLNLMDGTSTGLNSSKINYLSGCTSCSDSSKTTKAECLYEVVTSGTISCFYKCKLYD